MASKYFPKAELAAVAKKFRLRAGKTKIEIAAALGVQRPNVQQAEENPEQSLDGLRRRIIETCSDYRVDGPFYRLTKRPRGKPRQRPAS